MKRKTILAVALAAAITMGLMPSCKHGDDPQPTKQEQQKDNSADKPEDKLTDKPEDTPEAEQYKKFNWTELGTIIPKDQATQIIFTTLDKKTIDESAIKGKYCVEDNGQKVNYILASEGTVYYMIAEKDFVLPTNCSALFKDYAKVQSIVLDGISTAHVTNMAEMFRGCKVIEQLNVSGFNTSNVTDMNYMFDGLNKLPELDVSGFDTRKVTNMRNMFNGLNIVESIDVSGFVTDKVTNMENMFSGCQRITSLNLSKFNTAQVTSMKKMFTWNNMLEKLDLTSFDTKNVTNMDEMFSHGKAITEILVDRTKFVFNDNISMDQICFDTDYLIGNYGPDDKFKADPVDDEPVNVEKGTINFNSLYNVIDKETVLSIHFVDAEFAEKQNFSNQSKIDGDIFISWNEENHYYVWSSVPMYAPENCSKAFSGLTNVQELNLRGINTEKVTNMAEMFRFSKKITKLDISSFNTSNVTDMQYMFDGMNWLQVLDVSKLDTRKVTNMRNMFNGLNIVEALDVSGFVTDKVTNMENMFSGCQKITSLNLSKFNTAKVTSMKKMFTWNNKLEKLDLSSFNTKNVTTMDDMFSHGKSITEIIIDKSKFIIGKSTSTVDMFLDTDKLTGNYGEDNKLTVK